MQRADWRRHKDLCGFLSRAAARAGQENFFSGQAGSSREEWNKFRSDAARAATVSLARALSLAEQEVDRLLHHDYSLQCNAGVSVPAGLPRCGLLVPRHGGRPAAGLHRLQGRRLVLPPAQAGGGGTAQNGLPGSPPRKVSTGPLGPRHLYYCAQSGRHIRGAGERGPAGHPIAAGPRLPRAWAGHYPLD